MHDPVQVQELHHLYIVCVDLDRTIAFYTDLLGLQVRAEIDLAGQAVEQFQQLPGIHGRAVWGRIPGCPLRLEFVQWSLPAAHRVPTVADAGVQMLSFAVADIAIAAAAVHRAGIPIAKDVTMPDGSRVLLVRDPNGVGVELVQLPR